MKLIVETEKLVEKFSNSAYADFFLAIISFLEATIFPIPPGVFLIAIIVSKKMKRWLYYGIVVTIFSVLGGVFGYLIGSIFFDTLGVKIIEFYHLENSLIHISNSFNGHSFWTIFVAAFTPLPYKLFTIASGFFKIDIYTFIIASIIGRGIRFITMAYLTHLLGEKIAKRITNYLGTITIIGLIVITIIILFTTFF